MMYRCKGKRCEMNDFTSFLSPICQRVVLGLKTSQAGVAKKHLLILWPATLSIQAIHRVSLIAHSEMNIG